MAELVLTLNSFEFSGEFYKQTGVVAMGSRLGLNYACLFVGYVEAWVTMIWAALLHVVKWTSVSYSSLPPRFN